MLRDCDIGGIGAASSAARTQAPSAGDAAAGRLVMDAARAAVSELCPAGTQSTAWGCSIGADASLSALTSALSLDPAQSRWEHGSAALARGGPDGPAELMAWLELWRRHLCPAASPVGDATVPASEALSLRCPSDHSLVLSSCLETADPAAGQSPRCVAEAGEAGARGDCCSGGARGGERPEPMWTARADRRATGGSAPRAGTEPVPVFVVLGPAAAEVDAVVAAAARAMGFAPLPVDCSQARGREAVLRLAGEALRSRRIHGGDAEPEPAGSPPSRGEAFAAAAPSPMTAVVFSHVTAAWQQDSGLEAAVRHLAAAARRPILVTASAPPLALLEGLAAALPGGVRVARLPAPAPSAAAALVLAALPGHMPVAARHGCALHGRRFAAAAALSQLQWAARGADCPVQQMRARLPVALSQRMEALVPALASAWGEPCPAPPPDLCVSDAVPLLLPLEAEAYPLRLRLRCAGLRPGAALQVLVGDSGAVAEGADVWEEGGWVEAVLRAPAGGAGGWQAVTVRATDPGSGATAQDSGAAEQRGSLAVVRVVGDGEDEEAAGCDALIFDDEAGDDDLTSPSESDSLPSSPHPAAGSATHASPKRQRPLLAPPPSASPCKRGKPAVAPAAPAPAPLQRARSAEVAGLADFERAAKALCAASAADVIAARRVGQSCCAGGAGWAGWRPSPRPSAALRGPVTALRLPGCRPWASDDGDGSHRLAAAQRCAEAADPAQSCGDGGGCEGGAVAGSLLRAGRSACALAVLRSCPLPPPGADDTLVLLARSGTSYEAALQSRSARAAHLAAVLWPAPGTAPPDEAPRDQAPWAAVGGGRWAVAGALPCLDRALVAVQMCAAFFRRGRADTSWAATPSAGSADTSARARRRSRMMMARHPLSRALPRLDEAAKRELAEFGHGLATDCLLTLPEQDA